MDRLVKVHGKLKKLSDGIWVDLDYEDDPDVIDFSGWVPEIGPNFEAVQQNTHRSLDVTSSIPNTSKADWDFAVQKVASKCLPPTTYNAKSAQLVLGRVQAGKTSNFTGVISMLSDNGYQLFVVIAGITSNLRKQTLDRLTKDLGVAQNPGFEVLASDPQKHEPSEAQMIINRLMGSSKPANPFISALNRTLVYVVLKEDDHLGWFGRVLEEISQNSAHLSQLRITPVAVIDDEVDQASPDTYTNHADKIGKIHELVSRIRDLLPTHTYLGYTATPYANLLMSEGDALRCESISMLEPGPDYLGAVELFTPADNQFARDLTDWNFDREEIPKSLKTAFAVFIAQAAILNSSRTDRSFFVEEPMLSGLEGKTIVPASMLIHPHAQTAHASKVFDELSKVRKNWQRAVKATPNENGVPDHSYVSIWENTLYPAFELLGLPRQQVSELLIERTNNIIEYCEIREINQPGSTRGMEFPTEEQFSKKPAWVLIGGQLLDRGQTLPNLVNTYMPRPPGGSGGRSSIRGNIDTLQQRGRFYGHRRQYKNLLRGWFDGDTLASYKEIAVVEPVHLRAVQKLEEAGLGIDKLMMILELGSGDLKLVRNNVVPKEVRTIKNSTWLFRQTIYSPDTEKNQINQEAIRGLFREIDAQELKTIWVNSVLGRANLAVSVELNQIVNLLAGWQAAEHEQKTLRVCAELIDSYCQNGHDSADLILMSREPENWQSFASYGEYRTGRTLNDLMVNATNSSDVKITGLTSSNDTKFVPQGRVSIQVHYFDIKLPGNMQPNIGRIKANQVGLAIAFPNEKRLVIREGI